MIHDRTGSDFRAAVRSLPGSRGSLWATALGLALALALALAGLPGSPAAADEDRSFQRIATFPVFLNRAVDDATVAEIVAASEDGRTLVYTDSETGSLGFVDIGDPRQPRPLGTLDLPGEPTSVAVIGRLALTVVNTSPSVTAPSGVLAIVDLPTRTLLRTVDLGGQPDSIAIAPSKRFAAIAIENERDEDVDGGRPPQTPPGFLVIVDLAGLPDRAVTRRVELVGVADLFPGDPEPEFVDINSRDIAVVSLQENNHFVLVDLRSGRIVRDFPAGRVNLRRVDVQENDLIETNGEVLGVLREPDGVAWIDDEHFASADEGDLDGGSRSFTIFSDRGRVEFTSGNDVDQRVTRIGQYPEDRSENAGSEPEGVEFGDFGRDRFLFVGSERSSVVSLWRVRGEERPRFVQVLPAGVGPEGVLAIPRRGLLVAAAENDDRDAGFRSTLSIYSLQDGDPIYPTIFSENRRDGTAIPFAALSGLAGDLLRPGRMFTIYDSAFRRSRIFSVDIGRTPARIESQIVLREPGTGATVDLDLEGIAVRRGEGFWLVSEGAGSVDDSARPVTSSNLLLRVDEDGTIRERVRLPDAVNALQRRFGFEGVATIGAGRSEQVFIAFQREWVGDPARLVRIARYAPATGELRFFYYPIEAVQSPNGGFVGLSDLVAIDASTLAVVERDDQAGTDARLKRIYRFSIAGLDPQPQGGAFPIVTKTLVRDLIPDLTAGGGPVLEKVEGLGLAADGRACIATDNDAVVDSSGETQLLCLGRIFDRP